MSDPPPPRGVSGRGPGKAAKSRRPRRPPIARPLHVASVPSDHPYVSHLEPLAGPGSVLRLPDPPVPGAPAGQWWPSPVLSPGWLRAERPDVLHVHFGFEHLSLAQLAAITRSLVAIRCPLVLTVHDLENPHLADQTPHLAALEHLVGEAAEVITLTPGAAAEIGRRWGREPVVLPHPHVVPLGRSRRRPSQAADDAGKADDSFVVGLHDKPRAGNDPTSARAEMTATLAELGGQLSPTPDARLDDDALWDRIEGLDVLVLPYRHGTHSGFLEACADLGTTVVASRVGYLAEQQPHLSYQRDVPGSLAAALRQAHDTRPVWQVSRAARERQRTALAEAHTALYEQVAA